MSATAKTEAEAASVAQLERAVDASSRRVARAAAAFRALGSGNLLNEPLAPLLAGAAEMALLRENQVEEVRDANAPRVRSSTRPRTTSRKSKPPRPSLLTSDPPHPPPRAHQPDGLQVANEVIRHKVIDDVLLRECVPADGARQVVVINAGMGTRPYRLRLPRVRWFEVDTFEVLELKRLILANAPASFESVASKKVAEVKLVALSFDGDHDAVAAAASRLASELEKCGFDPNEKTVFVVENTLPSMLASDAAALFAAFPRANGSVVIGSAFPREASRNAAKYADDPAVDPSTATRVGELAASWRSDLEGLRRSGAFRGWRLRHVKGLSQHARAYGYRTPPPPWGENRGEEVTFELRRGRGRRPTRRGKPVEGPPGPPATADPRSARGARSRVYGEAPPWTKRRLLARLAALVAAGVVGRTKGDVVEAWARRAGAEAWRVAKEATAAAKKAVDEHVVPRVPEGVAARLGVGEKRGKANAKGERRGKGKSRR